jgi:colicin import membrane protein
MANPWVEHVKKKAKELNTTYGCAITMKEVKDSYKPKPKPKKAVKPRRKTEQKRMELEDINVAIKENKPSKEDIERVKKAIAKFRKMKEDKKISEAKKKKIQAGLKKLKEYVDKKTATIRYEKQEKKMKEISDNFNKRRKKITQAINQLDEKQLQKFKNLDFDKKEKLFKESDINIEFTDKAFIDRKVEALERRRERIKKEAEAKAKAEAKKQGRKSKKVSKEQLEQLEKFKNEIKDLQDDDEPFKIFGYQENEDLEELSENLVEDMGQTFQIQNVAEGYAEDELQNTDVIKMINEYLEGETNYEVDEEVKNNYDRLSNDDKIKLTIITTNSLIFGNEIEDIKAIRSLYIPNLSKYFKKNLKTTAKKYEITGLKI